MQYYSDKLKTLFKTEELLNEAEAKEDARQKKIAEERERLQAERKARADEVEDLRKIWAEKTKEATEAGKKYKEVLNNFLKDYKTYHYSTSDINELFDMPWWDFLF